MIGAARLLRGLSALALLALPCAGGCTSNMDPKECLDLRSNAFEILNKAQYCNTDADCRQSDWPGCAKPSSNETFEKLKPMKESFTKGKCADPKQDCRESPEVYCKQGLCVHREKSAPGSGKNADTPTDQIIIK